MNWTERRLEKREGFASVVSILLSTEDLRGRLIRSLNRKYRSSRENRVFSSSTRKAVALRSPSSPLSLSPCSPDPTSSRNVEINFDVETIGKRDLAGTLGVGRPRMLRRAVFRVRSFGFSDSQDLEEFAKKSIESRPFGSRLVDPSDEHEVSTISSTSTASCDRRDGTLLETGSLSERRVDLADLYFEKKYRSRRKRRKFLPFRPYSRFQREKISCIASINSIKIVFRGMTVRGRGKERTTRRKAGQKKEATKVAARPNRIRSNLASLGNRRTPTS